MRIADFRRSQVCDSRIHKLARTIDYVVGPPRTTPGQFKSSGPTVPRLARSASRSPRGHRSPRVASRRSAAPCGLPGEPLDPGLPLGLFVPVACSSLAVLCGAPCLSRSPPSPASSSCAPAAPQHGHVGLKSLDGRLRFFAWGRFGGGHDRGGVVRQGDDGRSGRCVPGCASATGRCPSIECRSC
jgi:hypothetical protein